MIKMVSVVLWLKAEVPAVFFNKCGWVCDGYGEFVFLSVSSILQYKSGLPVDTKKYVSKWIRHEVAVAIIPFKLKPVIARYPVSVMTAVLLLGINCVLSADALKHVVVLWVPFNEWVILFPLMSNKDNAFLYIPFKIFPLPLMSWSFCNIVVFPFIPIVVLTPKPVDEPIVMSSQELL